MEEGGGPAGPGGPGGQEGRVEAEGCGKGRGSEAHQGCDRRGEDIGPPPVMEVSVEGVLGGALDARRWEMRERTLATRQRGQGRRCGSGRRAPRKHHFLSGEQRGERKVKQTGGHPRGR
jgi:hypothetical protein